MARTHHGPCYEFVSSPEPCTKFVVRRLWLCTLCAWALAHSACVGKVHGIAAAKARASDSGSNDAEVSVSPATAAAVDAATVVRDAGLAAKSTSPRSDAGRTLDASANGAVTDQSADSGPMGTSAPVEHPHIQTVFLVLLENKTWAEMKGNADAAFLNEKLVPDAAIATNYKGAKRGKLHPSEPNLLWLEAGDNLGVTDDNDPAQNHQATTDHLVSLLEKAGITWTSYQEDIAGDVCPLTGIKQYMPKHNPVVFFDDVTNKNDSKSSYCIKHVRPLSELADDLQTGHVARYNIITPNLCNDMHSTCAPRNNQIKQGDDWLALWFPRLLASDAFKGNGAIFITWDEAEEDSPNCPSADCPMGLIVLSPLAKHGHQSSTAYDHSSTLKTMQEIFGVTPLLRAAADPAVHDLSDLFTSFP